MEFNFDSNLKSDSPEISELLQIFHSVRRVDTIDDLENIIKDAKSQGIKKVTIKDRRSSPIGVDCSDLFGNRVKVSYLKDKDRYYEIEFIDK